ncbi:MAG: BrnA antitoxin family protein [Candidatus Omnitrophica bacterium]|nr:BrnA antitoxin family protein [Candidatus Omnitrophota bacterium]MBU0896315.1 BrnA antitoxin family protein [Candidatus Omnitrophota bacterium]MBU1366631.1 BrnA antitoxin family protein [Candidatus Omnitrophota bacterium]MBU1523252.1 BrnA antitoxin family protein [Candidatus Omnitrophota bacterium]MBU1810449.1 BrnA antitoxin family protein [Candidatus Omnitrophota bacterium]
MKKQDKKITTEDFDRRFDKGEDMANFLDVKKVQVNKKIQRINVDIPVPFLMKIDSEAKRIGVARTALIKLWLSERLEHIQH